MGQRRKHVLQTAFSQDIQPPAGNQQIVRAVGARGGNIIEVEYPNGSTTLCMMPAKFNRKLWVRRGGYLIIEPSPEAEQDANSRVTGTICSVLYDEHIKQLKKMEGVWPEEFSNIAQTVAASTADDIMPPSCSEEEDDSEPEQQQQSSRADSQAGACCSSRQQQQPDPPGSTANPAVAGAAAEGQSTGLGHSGSGHISHKPHAVTDAADDSSDDDDGLPPLQQINNRRVVHYELSDDSDSDDE